MVRGARVLELHRSLADVGGAGHRLPAALRPLDRPALVLWGRHDPYIPVAHAERQREAFPGAEVQVLESSGHWRFADDPATVGAAVTGVPRPARRGAARPRPGGPCGLKVQSAAAPADTAPARAGPDLLLSSGRHGKGLGRTDAAEPSSRGRQSGGPPSTGRLGS